MIINGVEFPDMDDDEKDAVLGALMLCCRVIDFMAKETSTRSGLAMCALRLALFAYEESAKSVNKRRFVEVYGYEMAELALADYREDKANRERDK